MKRQLLTLSLILVGSVLFVAPAQATTCGGIEFTLVAEGNIGMGEPSTIGTAANDNGNVLSLTGTVTVGVNTEIFGKLFAPTINILAGGPPGRVLECHGTVTGDASACGAVFPFDPPAECTGTFPPPPLAVPVVDPCVNSSPSRAFSAAGNGTAANDLPSGCYRQVTLNDGAIV